MDSSSDHEDAKPSPTLPDRDDDDVTDELDLEERDIVRQMVKLDVHKFDKIVKVAKRALLERATLEGVDERAEVVNLTDDEDSASSGSSFDVDVIRQPGDFCPIHDTEQFSFSAPTLMGDDSEKRVRSRRVFTEVIDLSDEDSDDDDEVVEVIDNDNDHDGNEKEEEENNCVIIEEEIISKKTTARKKNKEKKIREKNHRSTETLGEANQKKVAESELFGDVPIDNLVDAYKNCGKMPEMDKRTDTKEVTVIKKNRNKYQSDLEEYISNSKDIIASQKTVTSKKSRNKPERLSKKKKVPQEVVLSDDDDDEVQVIYKNATKQRELPSKKKKDVELLLSSEDEDIYKPSTSTYQPKKKNKKPKNLVIHEGSDNDSLDGSLSINEERILSSIAKCKPTTEPPKEVLTTTITVATGSDDDGFGDDGSLTNDDAPPPPPIVQPSVIGLAGDDDATEEEELDVVMKNNRDNGEGASLPPVIDDSNEKKEEEKDNNDNPSVPQPISDSIEVELNQEDESQPPLIIDTEKVEKEEGMVSDDRNNDSPPLMMPDSVEVNKGNNNDPQEPSTEEPPVVVVPQVTGEMMMKVKIEREEELENIKIEVIVKKEVEPIREGETIDVSDDDAVVDVNMKNKEKAQKILEQWKPLPFTEYEIKHELEYGDVDAFFEEIGLSTGDEAKKKKPRKRQSQQQQPEMGQLFPITSKPKTKKGDGQKEDPRARPSTSGLGSSTASTASSSKRKKSRDVKEPTTRRDKRQKK